MINRRLQTLNCLLALAATVAIAATGCGSDSSNVDAISDSGNDSSADPETDSGVDAATTDARDNGPLNDTGTDAVFDTGHDSVDTGNENDNGNGDADAAAEVEDSQDATLPPLWEAIAPVGINTIDNTIGVSTHMEQSVGDNAHRNFEFEKYRELGTPTIREDYHWHRIEPADDQWNMDAVKGQVDMAIANDVKIVPMFGYQVDWAMTDTGNYSTIAWAEFGEFVGKVAETYCDYIKEYEIWNEENIPRFWAPHADPEAYGNLLKAAYEGIKTACPDARVAFGGMSSYDAETDLTDRFGFLKRVWQAHPDICEYFDIVAFHPYTFFQYYPPERDEIIDETLQYQGQSAQTEIIRAYLTEMGCPDRDLMITEQGWPSYDLTEDQVGRFLPRSILLAARDNVEKFMWYTFWDGYPTTEGVRPHESYFGLFGWTGDDGTVRRAKPAWNSLKALADLFGNMRFARDLAAALNLPNDVYALAFMSDGGDMAVATWDGRDFPDVSWGTEGPGGPDTTFDITMPLPSGFRVDKVFGVYGSELDANGDGAAYYITDTPDGKVLTMPVTPDVRYVMLKPETVD